MNSFEIVCKRSIVDDIQNPPTKSIEACFRLEHFFGKNGVREMALAMIWTCK